LAVALEYALGGLALGVNANNKAARIYFESSSFFGITSLIARHSHWLPVLVVITPIAIILAKLRGGRSA